MRLNKIAYSINISIEYKELKSLLEERVKLNQRHIKNEGKLLKAGGKSAEELQDSIISLSQDLGAFKGELATIESKDETDESLKTSNNTLNYF